MTSPAKVKRIDECLLLTYTQSVSVREENYYECKNLFICPEGIMSLALNVNLSQGLPDACSGIHKKAHSACLKIASSLQ